MTLLRRLRAALGLGVTWAVGWGVAGAALWAVSFLLLEPYQRARLGWDTAVSVSAGAGFAGALVGMVGGVLFALVLGFVERRKSIDQVSIPRTAALGAVAGLGIWVAAAPSLGLLAGSLVAGGVFTAFGAISAATTLAVAKRGSLGTGELHAELAGGVEP